MKKMQLYPKTQRISDPEYQITEKLDGSNIGIFNLFGELLIAERNVVFKLQEIDEIRGSLYKGLYGFLKENGEDLLSKLHEGSGFFGEWMGMGQIKYGGAFKDKLYIFAKAQIAQNYEDDYEISNLYWKRDLLKYPFRYSEIPEYLKLTPLVGIVPNISIESLDKIYEEYLEKVGRQVEGFVVMSENGAISKYVRNKRGRLSPHEPKGRMDWLSESPKD